MSPHCAPTINTNNGEEGGSAGGCPQNQCPWESLLWSWVPWCFLAKGRREILWEEKGEISGRRRKASVTSTLWGWEPPVTPDSARGTGEGNRGEAAEFHAQAEHHHPNPERSVPNHGKHVEDNTEACLKPCLFWSPLLSIKSHIESLFVNFRDQNKKSK